MTPKLPVPLIVSEAQTVIATHERLPWKKVFETLLMTVFTGASGIGFATFASIALGSGSEGAGLLAVVTGLCTFLFGLVLSVQVSHLPVGVPTAGEVADAQAVLEAWEGRRGEWIAEQLDSQLHAAHVEEARLRREAHAEVERIGTLQRRVRAKAG